MTISPTNPWRPFTLIRTADYEAMSREGAALLAQTLRRDPRALICLATGGSPARTYELFAEAGRREPALCRDARFVKLDEWGGLAATDPSSCEGYLRAKLVEPLGLRPEQFQGWRCQPADPAAECRRVAAWLDANGPIDVCVLGLGLNGHLGFNEPAPALQAGPHVAQLSATSLAHSMLGGDRNAIPYGLTIGMGNILQSRQVVLLVNGPHKQAALRRLATREITPDFPASFLWLHPAFTLIADHAALDPAAWPA